MKEILKYSLLASMLLVPRHADRTYPVSLPLSQWQQVFNAIEYRKVVLIHSSDPSYLVTPQVDTLSVIEGAINTQLSRAMSDTTKPRKGAAGGY